MSPEQEEISICDAVRGLSLGIDEEAILMSLRNEATNRRARIQKLRSRILAGEYSVEPGAVAAAILLEGDLMLQ